MQYRRDIDGLRAVAVLGVLCFHADKNLLPGGFVGVDIFFVISGYLICQIIMRDLEAGEFTIRHFYERRARRILPALLAVILFALCAGLLVHLPSDLEMLGESAIASSLFLSNFFFMNEVHYFASDLENYPLLHLWSLAVEEQFYIITPIVMVLAYRYGGRCVVWCLVLLAALSLLSSVLMVAFNPIGAFYMLPSRFWEMGVGAILGITVRRSPHGGIAHVASCLGGCLMLGSFFLLSEGPPFPGLLALPCVIGAALYIWAGPDGLVNRLLSSKFFVWIGLISYSLYLWHWPLLSYARYVKTVELSSFQTLIAVIASFVAAFLSYRFVEQPFRKKTVHVSSLRFTSSFTAVISLLCLLGTVLTVGQGFPNRWQPGSLAAMNVTGKVDPSGGFGCRNVSLVTLQSGNTCEVGSEKEHYDFIVWGDSHAGAMRAGFAQMAMDTDAFGLVIFKNGCSSLLGRRNRNLPFRENCNEYNLEVMGFLDAQPTKDVILVSHWLVADSISHFHSGNSVSFLEAILRLPESGGLEDSIERTVAALEEQGKRVFWLKTVPGQLWHVPSTMAKSLEWARPLPRQLSRDDYEAMQTRIDNFFASAGSTVAIPTVDVFCDAFLCYGQRDGSALYFDDNHVSQHGSILAAQAIRQTLEENSR